MSSPRCARRLCSPPHDAAAVIKAVNRQLHSASPVDRYATLFYGIFHEDTRILEYVNAGHNPPVVVRQGKVTARLEVGGPPVGVFADSVYRPGVVELFPGDLIVAYTDGVVEATDRAGEEWGVEGLLAAVARADGQQPDKIVEAAFTALEGSSGHWQRDDATILVALVR